MDIGFLIKKEVLELGCVRVDKQPLIFPSLITAFCQEAGVDFGVDGFDLGLGPVDRGTWLHQAREKNPSGIRVRTGRKKNVASSSRQQEEIPEQEEYGHDFQFDMGYDHIPTPPQIYPEEFP